jgi:hypothetical protein
MIHSTHSFTSALTHIRATHSYSSKFMFGFGSGKLLLALPAQSFLVPGLTRLMTIFFCLTTLGEVQLLPASGHCFMHVIFLERSCAFARGIHTRHLLRSSKSGRDLEISVNEKRAQAGMRAACTQVTLQRYYFFILF